MAKSVWSQQDTRTRLGREFIILTGPRERVTTCHTGSQGNMTRVIRNQKTGVRGRA